MSTASNHYHMKSNIRMIRLDSKDPICYTIKVAINQIKKIAEDGFQRTVFGKHSIREVCLD